MSNQLDVLIAHGDAIVIAGLSALPAAQTDLHITVATNDAAAIHADPDVIILDHQGTMEHMRRRTRAHVRQKQSRVLIVTQLDREWDVYTAMMTGVHGYLLQSANVKQRLTAVFTLSRGMHYVSPT